MGHRAWSSKTKNSTPLLVRKAHSAERVAFKDVENKKLRFPSHEEGVELYQRTGQLANVS
jgi:hypothetical protein